MHGRGYVNEGDKIAANYIAGEFNRLNLEHFHSLNHSPSGSGNTYFQDFMIPVNTFPGKWGIGYRKPGSRADTSWFIPGSVALVNPASPSITLTKSKFIWLDSSIIYSQKKTRAFIKNRFENKVIVIDEKGVLDPGKQKFINAAKENPFGAKCMLVFNNRKLTWDAARELKTFPSFEILVPDSANAALHKSLDAAGDLYYQVESKFRQDYKTQNVIAWIKGTLYPDSFIVFTAHYDHLGQMGKDIYFPGANDNASGCAMLLNLAKYYSARPAECSIAFMAFGAEEAGLLGSGYYVDHPVFPLERIKFLLNLDLLGTGDEGITVVNGTIYKTEFDELLNLNAQKHHLPLIKPRGKAANSDHYFFSEKGVKSFFIYTLGGIKAYHDIYDRPETLPLSKFEDVFRLLTDFTNYLQKN
jgi:aminopeptidase YwaD